MFCPAFSKAGKMFPKGNGFILFASAKRTKKQTGFHPATSVQIAGRNGVFTEMTGFHQVTGYVQPLFRTESTAMIWTAANSKPCTNGYAALYELEADSFDDSRLWRTAKGKLWGCGNGLLFQIERNFSGNARFWLKSKFSINAPLLLANAKLQKFI